MPPNCFIAARFVKTIDKIMAGEPMSIEHRARNRRDQGFRFSSVHP